MSFQRSGNRANGNRVIGNRLIGCAVVGISLLAAAGALRAQSASKLPGTENGEWRYIGGDSGSTRYSPLTQINASNFSKLKVAWVWRSDNFGPSRDYFSRATPLYVDGMLYTVATPRRQVIAIHPVTGETLWTFREPETIRHKRSPRQAYGKGVGYGEINGRGVVYVVTPGFFLWALDAKTGDPIENWGAPPPLKGFAKSGVVDLLPPLLGDWGRWKEYLATGKKYDPDYGIPRELGMVTNSAPPIVVNGVIVVPIGHEPGYGQTRIENVPGDVMGFDAKTGKFLWKFHVLPRPGEAGHETWKNDAWKWSGNMASWAPFSADPQLGLVYLVTNASTVQSYTGHRPGDNLFGGSVLALDVRTGKRKWHFQIHHSDQWNYDLPTAPILLDLTVNGRTIPALVQNTKQGFIFAFNRETGEPIWPIEEKPVMQTEVPGNYTSPTQPYPTRPEPVDPIVWKGLTEEFVIDYTPDLKRRAMEILSKYRIGGLYVPPLPVDHKSGFVNNVGCLGGGNVIPHPPVADPTTGLMYVSHHRTCTAPPLMVPTNGKDEDDPSYPNGDSGVTPNRTPTTGTTVVAWKPGPAQGLPLIEGLRLWKPMDNQLTAYQMNSGDKVWSSAVGQTPDRVKNHPMLRELKIPNTGGGGFGSVQMVMGELLLQAQGFSEGTAQMQPEPPLQLNARDKRTGEILASVALPAPAQYGMMSFMHQGKQYIVVQVGHARADFPGGLVALALP